MIQSACEHLIETRGYHSAWIALVDEDRGFLTAAEAGLGERFAPVIEMMKRGEFTRREQRVLDQSGVVVVKDVASDCAGCPLADTCSEMAGMTVSLKSGDRVYGMLSVSIPDEMASDADEQPLFNEVADDIAFGLYRMELEEERKKAEDELGRYRDHLEEMVEERTAELMGTNYELKQEIAERKKAEALIEHLNSVLGAIRNVNQLIVSEKDRDSLLQKSCDALVEARGYDAAWIGLLQDGKNFVTVKCSGFAEDSSRFCEYVMDGTHPPRIRNALAHNDIFAIADKSGECEGCPFDSECTGKEIAVIRLEHAGRLFGLLVVSLVADVTAEEEEADLLKEVASDLAFALHDMEVEEAHRAAEEKLLESEGRYQRMVANVPGLVYQFVMHPDGPMAFHFVSESCRELFGMEPHEIMRDANVLLDLVHPDDREGFYRSIADSAKSLSPWGWEGRGTISGEERWFQCMSRPERQANGDILWDGLVTDITKHKLAEKRINEEYRRAEFYIDLMGHDINNLSQVTGGHLELLLRMPNIPSKFRKYAETALDHVRKSASIISNVKTLSTVRSGELEIEKIDIYPAFASAVETAKSQSRDVRINSNITKDRYFIRGNGLLFDVFSNLLNNAVKFDGHDIIEIDVDISLSGDDWVIEVKDRGRGIRHDHKKIIFNRLEQAGESAQGSDYGKNLHRG
jgi:PAS domain S-box-containing protein